MLNCYTLFTLLTLSAVSTGMGDHLQASIPPQCVKPAAQSNSAFYPHHRDRKWERPKYSPATAAGE